MIKLPKFDGPGLQLSSYRKNAFNYLNYLIYNQKFKVEKITKCFCSSENFHTLSFYDRFGLPFGTQICKDCGLITQTLRIHPDNLSELYDKIYWPLVDGSEIPTFVTEPKKNEKDSFILKHIKKSELITIFEIGCGSGTRISKLKNELESKGNKVKAIACDYSDQAVTIASKKSIQVIKGGVDEISKFGKADILILSHVFEHMPDLKNAIQEILKLTHDDSLVYIEVPGVLDLVNKKEYGYSYQDYNILVHTYNFSLNTLSNVLSTGGFKLVEGDEYIRAVFQKGKINKINSSYLEIINSITKAYERQLILEKSIIYKLKNYIKKVLKAILNKS